MKTILLGQSALTSSRLAYGCWRIAGPGGSDLSPDRIAHGVAAVRAAWEAGYTCFDLADIYAGGQAEEVFGRALKEIPALRAGALIATKCGIRMKGEPADAPYRYDFSPTYIEQCCDASLRRLGLETIDLYQLHRPDYLCDPEAVAGVFAKLQQAGKVREFGVSNFRPSQVTMLQRACGLRLQVNQVEISLAHLGTLHDGTLDQCLAERITPMAWSPFGGGRLGGTGGDLTDPDHAHRFALRDAMDAVAREQGVSRFVLALAWLLKHPAGIVPIVGSTQPDRIRDAVHATTLELSREQWYRLLEAALGQRLP